jgi:LacI family transcriptional regulator
MLNRIEIAMLMDNTQETNWHYRAAIASHSMSRLPWWLLFEEPSLRGVEEISQHPISGIIGTIGDENVARSVKALDLPVVNLWGGHPLEGLPQVGLDDVAAAGKAAEYLISLKLPHLSCEGLRELGSLRMTLQGMGRCRGFRHHLRLLHHRMETMPLAKRNYPALPNENPNWSNLERLRCRWLAQLPKPIGIFASDDLTARQLVSACRDIDIAVPQEVAILGCNNDRAKCNGIYPQISSIELPAEQVGKQAASMLESLLNGEPLEQTICRIPPGNVIVRESTRFIPSFNHHVLRAMKFIQVHESGPLNVDEVAQFAACCRRTLENLFRSELGSTVFQEIRKSQINHLKHVLVETDLSFEQIAFNLGYNSPPHLMTEFKKHTGMTPRQFRKRKP